MAGFIAALFVATSLLFSQQVQGSGELVPAPTCNTREASAALMECKADFLESAGQNFDEDCEAGVVKDFMRCVNSFDGCTNTSAFLEKALYDYYGYRNARVPKRVSGSPTVTCVIIIICRGGIKYFIMFP